MPDITYPNTISAGATTNATALAENIFKAQSTQNNLEVINRLDRTNLGTALITRQMVRPGAFFEGSSGGHTANRDFFKQAYPGGWGVTTITEAADAAVPVAGLCRSKRFDNTNALFNVSWGFGVIIDDGHTIGTGEYDFFGFGGPGASAGSGNHTSMHLFINGVRITRANWFLRHSDLTMAQFDLSLAGISAETPAKAYFQDSRWIAGSYTIDAVNASLWFTGDTAALSPLLPGVHTAELRVASKKRIVRFKSSNISILGMR